ncbi:MAG: sensor histidine kinase [Streptosporangiaceae bacterium]
MTAGAADSTAAPDHVGPPGRHSRLSRPGGSVAGQVRAAGAADRHRWPLGRIIGVAMAAVGAVLIAAIVFSSFAIGGLDSARGRVVDVLDPAALHGSQLYAALLNQETGLRGYLLSGQGPFLQPYTSGLAAERAQLRTLRPLLAGLPGARGDLADAVRQAEHWRSTYAIPAMNKVAPAGLPLPGGDIATGKAEFDAVRAPLAAFQRAIAGRRAAAKAQLRDASDALEVIAISSAIALLVVLVGLAAGLRVAATRPLARLAADARQVADGDFEHGVDPTGPREVHALAADVDRMRRRILRELSAVRAANVTLEARAHELERSNTELEQFAYVASHDLQEPLRKVASFCQLLQRRYIGQLDARADQYIEFAVDGAKRMQALIDDLLAFSRVGRLVRDPVLVSCASALSQARVNLIAETRGAKAVIETTELPAVRAEFSLLTSLFQNLIGNAIKFRSQRQPVVRVSATPHDEGFWLFSVTDNGIGIEPEYAERIFVIFQRLHGTSEYDGTGIGLAMCRKIVEHYGGRIWLDTTHQGGTNFCFTLPVAPIDDEEPSP